jgi:hypothetical protein
VNALARVETGRLAKLHRLIFGSDKDGEIAAAVAAVKRLLAASDLDAHWLADLVERGTKSIELVDRRDDDPDHDHSAAWFAFHRRHQLSPKERAFVVNIVERSAPLTPKQRQWLNDICDRLAEVAFA